MRAQTVRAWLLRARPVRTRATTHTRDDERAGYQEHEAVAGRGAWGDGAAAVRAAGDAVAAAAVAVAAAAVAAVAAARVRAAAGTVAARRRAAAAQVDSAGIAGH